MKEFNRTLSTAIAMMISTPTRSPRERETAPATTRNDDERIAEETDRAQERRETPLPHEAVWAMKTRSPLRLIGGQSVRSRPRQSEQLPSGRSQKPTRDVSRGPMRFRPVSRASIGLLADDRYAMALAIAKAAAAASPPISTVCSPLRTGEVPVK